MTTTRYPDSSSCAARSLQRTKAVRSLCQLMVAAGLALGASGVNAGVLLDIYSGNKSTDSAQAIADLNTKAAEQNVITQEKRYMPRLSILARELWVFQNVRQSGNPLFPEGKTDFDDTRVNVELDQPLYDPTVKPQVEAARARQRQQAIRNQGVSEWRTRQLVDGFMKTVRLRALSESADRVIVRLEKELEGVTKSYDAKVSTITDVQNIKLALASMKRERNNFTQQLNYELARMGEGGEQLKAGWVQLAPNAGEQLQAAPESGAGAEVPGARPEVELLRAEASEIGHQADAANRRSLPRLSVYAQYGLDDAGGSLFGGAQNYSNYEVGLAVKWDIFDRGMNRSEAREFNLRKRAKELELASMATERTRSDGYSKELLAQSRGSVAELADLVKQHEVLKDASARAYEAGKESYINSVTAYLAYESTVREYASAQYDLLMHQIDFYAQGTGWNETLIKKVDGLFVAAK